VIQVGLLSTSLAVRVGLRALLEADDQVVVVAEAGRVDETLESFPQVDVLIVESGILSDPQIDSFPFSMLPETAVLIIGDITRGMRSWFQSELHAWGVLPQEASQEELLAAVQALDQGLIVGEPSMIVPMMRSHLHTSESVLDGPIETLTERELEVLQLLAQGLANKQIAVRLNISAHTVKFHIASIYGKLGASNRTEAVRIGLQLGLILL
jgi:NarL family two-component system response regulator YdfI